MAKTSMPKHTHSLHKVDGDLPDGSLHTHDKKGPHKGAPKHAHPLHKPGVDHHDLSAKEKHLKDGPHLPMPKHQHDLHHPHTEVDGHKATHPNIRNYK